MPRVLRSSKRQRLEPAPEPSPEPSPDPPEETPQRPIIRLYGDSYGDTPVDFQATNAQLESAFVTKLPAEIRAQIYRELWADAGLSQHLIMHSVDPGGGDTRLHSRFHHTRCITKHDAPDDRGPPPGNLFYKDARRRLKKDPTFSDGTDPMWKEDCYHCKQVFDCFFDVGNLPHCPIERNTPFMPMLVCCKKIYLESVQSIAEHVCFNFVRHYQARMFLELKLPIIYQMRQIMIAEDLAISEWALAEWATLSKLFETLTNLRTIVVWFDTDRRWRNNKPRSSIAQPRLLAFFDKIPARIRIEVSVPSDALDVPEDPEKKKKGSLFRQFVKHSGGFVEEAKLEQVVGNATDVGDLS